MVELMLTREQVRAVDRIAIEDYGVPGVVLMENAGRGAAEMLLDQSPLGRILIICGKGNNGGDGFVIARHLDNAGVDVRVVLLTEPEELTGDAATNYRIVEKMGLVIHQVDLPRDAEQLKSLLDEADWVVDAILGTGLTGPARGPYAMAIEYINVANTPVLAVDIPSGLDCDLGPVLDLTVKADMTATFVALKTGLCVSGAMEFTGDIRVVDIGAPRQILSALVGNNEA